MIIYPKQKNIRTRGFSIPQEIKWGVPVVKSGDWYATRSDELPYMKTMFQAGPYVNVPSRPTRPGFVMHEDEGSKVGLGWSDVGFWDTLRGGGCTSTRHYRVCAIPTLDAGIIAASGCGSPGTTCTTASGNPGRQYCCTRNPSTVSSVPSSVSTAAAQGYDEGSSGKPSPIGVAASTAATTSEASAANIRLLQQFLLTQGCTLPRYGVDGRWGRETAAAVECAGGVSALTAQFPFLTALAGTESGGVSRAVSAIIGGATEAGASTVVQPSAVSRFFDLRNPMLWFSVGGIFLVLGTVGYFATKKKKRVRSADLGMPHTLVQR